MSKLEAQHDKNNTAISKVSNKQRLKWIVFGSIFLAIALGVSLFFAIPYFATPKFDTNNLVARMNLDNGMTIDYELFADDAPHATAVFVYLAETGFFDNTIIIDVQNSFVRFGGYTNYKQHRQDDPKWLDNLRSKYMRDDAIPSAWKDNPLNFRPLADYGNNTTIGNDTQKYWLSYMSGNTSTEFQVAGATDASLYLDGQTPAYDRQVRGTTSFGKVLQGKSRDNIDKLAELKNNLATRDSNYHDIWWPPSSKITIKSITIYNLDKQPKYKNYNFYADILTDRTNWLGGTGDTTGWYGGAIR